MESVIVCEPSCSLPEGGYIRTFEAQIDDYNEKALFVRGTLSDHRCKLEHTWILQTPEYKVIEASARHLSGEPDILAAMLPSRYSDIQGVRIGRGFTQVIRQALGDLPGRMEHLALAIEMARVGQQAFKAPQKYYEQFFPLVAHMPDGPSRTARLAWEQDRNYLPDLCDSCYAYRQESAQLFDQREVVSFNLDFVSPKPGKKCIFWRHKRLHIRARLDGTGFHCSSKMNDTIHEIEIEFDMDHAGKVSEAKSQGIRLPYHGICEDPHRRTPGLNGQKLDKRYINLIGDQIGGSTGCAHLFDLSVDSLRFFNWLV